MLIPMPILFPVYKKTTIYREYDDSRIQRRIDELEDGLSKLTGVEMPGTKARRIQAERESDKWNIDYILSKMPKDTLKLLVYGTIHEEYEHPYVHAPVSSFAMLESCVKFDKHSHCLLGLTCGLQRVPRWIDYKIHNIRRRIWGIFKVGTGYRVLEIQAPKIVLDAIKDHYMEEYAPKLEEIVKKNPLLNDGKNDVVENDVVGRDIICPITRKSR